MNKQAKIKKVMEEFKNGTLKTSDGKVVKNRKQAVAIAMSESEDYAEKGLISQINIGSVSEAEDIIKAAGSEELFEKAQPGDEREYQGRMYVYGTTKSGKMGWKVKEKVKRGNGTGSVTLGTTGSASSSNNTSQINQLRTSDKNMSVDDLDKASDGSVITISYKQTKSIAITFTKKGGKWYSENTMTRGKVPADTSQILNLIERHSNKKIYSIKIDLIHNKPSNAVVHDINGTKVTVTKNSDGSYTLEANGKKVRSDDPSFFVNGTNIKPKVKNALAKELDLDTASIEKKLRPIGTGTNGPERRKK